MQDGSGGEFVFLNDGSIGFICNEGEVERIAESSEGLLTFLLHTENFLILTVNTFIKMFNPSVGSTYTLKTIALDDYDISKIKEIHLENYDVLSRLEESLLYQRKWTYDQK